MVIRVTRGPVDAEREMTRAVETVAAHVSGHDRLVALVRPRASPPDSPAPR